MTNEIDDIATHIAVVLLSYERMLMNAVNALRFEDDVGVSRNLGNAEIIIRMMEQAALRMTAASDALNQHDFSSHPEGI